MSKPRLAILLALASSLGACSCERDPGLEERTPELGLDGGTVDASGAIVVDFGEVPLGGRRQRQVSIVNRGSAELHVELPAIDAPFSTGAAAELAVAEGSSLPLDFVFAPTAEGLAEATVALASDGGAATLRLRGVGVPPALVCTPSPLAFGGVVVGGARTLPLSCENRGTGTLSVEALPPTDLAFRHDGEGAVELVPGDTLSLEVTFVPPSETEVAARLPLVAADGAELGSVALTGHGILRALTVDPDVTCPGIDFGYVPPGRVAEKTLTVRSLGGGPIAVDVRPPTGAVDFRASPTGPRTLRPDDPATPGREDELTVTVLFAAEAEGRRQGRLRIESDDPAQPAIEICLEGFAGGPFLTCTPGAVDFGSGVVGTTSRRTVVCTNAGTDDTSTLDDRLQVSELTTTGAAFSARPLAALRPEGYGVGETFEVEVSFVPGAEGEHAGTLDLASNAGPLAVPLAGRASDLPACELGITPAVLAFGVVEPGLTATRVATLENQGTADCVVEAVALGAGTDPAYSLPGPAFAPRVLAPAQTTQVAVQLDSGAGQPRFEGSLEVTISNPADPVRTVPLVASGCPQVGPDGSCEAATEAVYVHDQTELSSFDPSTGAASSIGTFTDESGTEVRMTDLAIDRSGRMFAVSSSTLYEVDPRDASVTTLRALDQVTNGLTALDDGRLVAAGDAVEILDPVSGRVLEVLVEAGTYVTSGDIIALPDGFLYWAVRGGDQLVRIDPAGGALTVAGDIGEIGVFGLGYAYGELLGFTRDGTVLTIDPATAAVLDRAPVGAVYWGAATNPVLW